MSSSDSSFVGGSSSPSSFGTESSSSFSSMSVDSSSIVSSVVSSFVSWFYDSFSSFSSSSSSEGGGTGLYVILAILSPIACSFTNIVDKTAVSGRVKHTPSYLMMIGVVDMLIALIIAACCDWSPEALEGTVAMDFLFPVFAAFCWAGSIYCYYIGLLLADASIIVGVEYLYPLIVVILSAIFLHERIGAIGYVGCVLLVVGAMTLSLNFIGMICQKCKKSRADQEANKERRLVLGSGYGPFQNAVIPAGYAASILNAGSTEEARAAFSAILGWRGAFVMPIMADAKVKKVNDTYVDVEAGCAPGVSCWCPCCTWCSNCTKVVGTKSEAKKDKKKNKKEETEKADGEEESSGKKKKIDSRKSLESNRNVRVRRASAAAVNATVNRQTPEYDTVMAEKKSEEEQQVEQNTSTAVLAEEEKEKKVEKKSHSHSKHHHSSHSHSNHHHHKNSHHHHHSSHHKDEADLQKHQLGSDSEDDDEEEDDKDVEDEEKLDANAVPLDEVHHDEKKEEEEEDDDDENDDEEEEDDDEDDDEDDEDDDEDDDEVEDREEEEEEEDGKKKKSKKDDEERNCITAIIDFCGRHKDSKGLLMAALIPLTIMLAMSEFMSKVSTAKLNTFNVCSINFFTFGFLMFSIVFVTPFKGAKYFIGEFKRNWLFCIMSDILTLTGQFLLIFAMSGMSASIVSSLAAIQPFVTLCLERIFGIASDSLKDCLSYKLVPIILIVAGVVMLSLTVI